MTRHIEEKVIHALCGNSFSSEQKRPSPCIPHKMDVFSTLQIKKIFTVVGICLSLQISYKSKRALDTV